MATAACSRLRVPLLAACACIDRLSKKESKRVYLRLWKRGQQTPISLCDKSCLSGIREEKQQKGRRGWRFKQSNQASDYCTNILRSAIYLVITSVCTALHPSTSSFEARELHPIPLSIISYTHEYPPSHAGFTRLPAKPSQYLRTQLHALPCRPSSVPVTITANVMKSCSSHEAENAPEANWAGA